MTAVRVDRLVDVLLFFGGMPAVVGNDAVIRTLWRRCGGPFDDIALLVDILVGVNLLVRDQDTIRRTPAGHKVARTLSKGGIADLGVALIRAGVFHAQARTLIEAGTVGEDGSLSCSIAAVRRGGAQLVGLLSRWPAVQLSSSLIVVPAELLNELNSVWALLPPPLELPGFALERKQVGDRAELYSVQTERSRISNPSMIAWVARESDTLGWDVEDRSVTPHRCVEVKGRRDADVVFYLSENEWRRAQELGALYEVHFWGEIDLRREPALEYAALRAAGYPLVIKDFAAQHAAGLWVATATRWRVMPANTVA